MQRQVFARQLQLAVECDLPVVIHTREADDDTMAILREYAPQLRRKGVVHSFTSGMELAQVAVELGFCLGINGIVTFNKADNVREVVAATPLTHLLLETDAPFLTPVPFRGVENAPLYLPFVAEKIAEVKGIHVEDVLEQTYRNAMRGVFQPGGLIPLLLPALQAGTAAAAAVGLRAAPAGIAREVSPCEPLLARVPALSSFTKPN